MNTVVTAVRFLGSLVGAFTTPLLDRLDPPEPTPDVAWTDGTDT